MDGSSTPGPWVVEDGWLQREAGPFVDGRYLSVCVTATDIRDIALMTAAPDFAEVAPDAADILERYAEFIRTVASYDLERHPYLPEVERIAETLRAAISKASSRQPEGER